MVRIFYSFRKNTIEEKSSLFFLENLILFDNIQ